MVRLICSTRSGTSLLNDLLFVSVLFESTSYSPKGSSVVGCFGDPVLRVKTPEFRGF